VYQCRLRVLAVCYPGGVNARSMGTPTIYCPVQVVVLYLLPVLRYFGGFGQQVTCPWVHRKKPVMQRPNSLPLARNETLWRCWPWHTSLAN
jgi:hypothetical protein